jgi:hypothetical protein
MNKITPRTPQITDLKDKIGHVLNSNLFSTLRGRLLYIQKDKCYFEIIPNPGYTKYNNNVGHVEYLPEAMVVCMKFEEE